MSEKKTTPEDWEKAGFTGAVDRSQKRVREATKKKLGMGPGPEALRNVSKLLKTTLENALNLLADEVRKRTPVDTGRLRNSIRPEITSIEDTEVIGNVGTDVYYAIYVEYGHTHQRKDEGFTVVPPRAMFRRGLAASRSKIRHMFRELSQELRTLFRPKK